MLCSSQGQVPFPRDPLGNPSNLQRAAKICCSINTALSRVAHGLWNPCDQVQAIHPLPPNCRERVPTWRVTEEQSQNSCPSALLGGRETVPLSSREHIPTPMAVSGWVYGAEPTMLTQREPSPRSAWAPLHYLPPLWDPAE